MENHNEKHRKLQNLITEHTHSNGPWYFVETARQFQAFHAYKDTQPLLYIHLVYRNCRYEPDFSCNMVLSFGASEWCHLAELSHTKIHNLDQL